jgi:hypothetical protein
MFYFSGTFVEKIEKNLTLKYTLYNGKFICQTCKAIVETARMYKEKQDLTWMCANKHLSKVNFNVRGY